MAVWPPTLLGLLERHQTTEGPRAPLVERMAFLQSLLGPLPFPLIKVTGTNGKGSVCAMTSAVLVGMGFRVGCFTSPHLVHVAERFRLNGTPVSELLLEDIARDWQDKLADLAPRRYPTFFEILLAVGLDLFRRLEVDFVVLEAGIGGYRDATHLLPEVVAAVTSVGLDHAEQLGPTLRSVAVDKAGICSAGGTLVLAASLCDEARAAIQADAGRRGVRLITDLPDVTVCRDLGLAGFEVTYGAEAARLPLAGGHQLSNLRTVLALAEALREKGLLAQLRLSGLENTVWPGRLQPWFGRAHWLLDVGHNPEALSHTAAALAEMDWQAELLIYGVAQEKDVLACAAILPHLAKEVILVDGFYRATPRDTVRALLDPSLTVLGCFEATSLPELIRSRPTKQRVLVTGSVFLVGLFLEQLAQHDPC